MLLALPRTVRRLDSPARCDRLTLFAMALFLSGCLRDAPPAASTYGANPTLPAPQKSLLPTMNIAPAVGWRDGETPLATAPFVVNEFARGLDHPRWLYVLPNGDVLVAETNAPERPDENQGVRGWVQKQIMKRAGAVTPSANRITLLRDTDADGVADLRTVFLDRLNSPFGMALVNGDFYVANTDAIVRFPYRTGATHIDAPGEKIADLPAGSRNHHWTKNLIARPDGAKLYATVGSNSNVAEHGMDIEAQRAAILEIDIASRTTRMFASGLRNPNGLDWHPDTKALWTVVNERDELGDDLVPDYLTSVRDGGFYGWPYSYYGQHIDERVQPQRPDLVASALVPDYALGSHTASLGLTFYRGALFPERYRNGAFIGQHGSWNRSSLAGYKVVFVAFDHGRPVGKPEDVLAGFINDKGQARGRPVGVVIDGLGALLVADDVGNRIWRVAPAR